MKRLTSRRQFAANALSHGASRARVARELGINRSRLARRMTQPTFLEQIDRIAPTSKVELSRGPQPPTAGRKYVKAWDIADSQDFAVGVVLDVTEPMHDVVYFERHRGIGYPALQKRIEWVHRRYGGPTVIEDNAMGAAVRQNLDIRPNEVVAFVTTAKSKARIIAGLEVAIENETLTYDSEAWPELDRELRSYVRDDKDSHQDTVMALGLAEEHAVLGQLGARRKGRLGRVIRVGSGAPGRYADPRRALGRSG